MSFTIDPEQLDELITQLARFGRSLESVQTDVQSRMNRVHAVWRGVAAEEQAAAHARWRTGSQEMHEALQTMRTVVATAQENYSAAIRVNGALWAR
ncbi:WXG100 family type VII secretion target [uncultured Jatrophihabitans sp.]|uniref:WXG100 family type VII secretion target n=1 Tax=uncultured Jatrophihabitans sp. TaxID=1610747 RepID=UPI0035CA8592